MKLRLWVAAGLAIGFTAPALAQDKAETCDGPQNACQQIISTPQKFAAAFNRKDAAGTAAVFTQDAILVPEGPIVSGLAEVEKFWAAAIQGGASDLAADVHHIHVVGDTGWGVGDWSYTGPGPNHTTQRYRGHWSGVWGREGDAWKVRLDTFFLLRDQASQSGEASSASR
jgi:uncharacterized protein (TIGR02246 family)